MSATDFASILGRSSITTGVKTLGNTIVQLGARTIQSFNSLTTDEINQYIKNQLHNFEVIIKDTTRSCTGTSDMRNIKEKRLIDNLICKIISNKQQDVYLEQETLEKLVAILISSGKYVVLTTDTKEQQDNAFKDAILTGALGSALVSNIVDSSTEALKAAHYKGNSIVDQTMRGTQEMYKTKLPSTDPTTTFVQNVALGAPAGIALSAVTFAIGLDLYKKINQKIPQAYKPNLHNLVTAYTKKQLEIVNLRSQVPKPTALITNKVEERKQLKEALENLFKLTDMTSKDKTDYLELIEIITPFLNNIKIEDISVEEINRIKNEVQQALSVKPSSLQSFSNFVENPQEFIIPDKPKPLMTQTNFMNFFTGKGGRKSRKLRKQKRRKGRKTRRHN